MNCKQGDLAFYVRSVAGNEGHIVRCVRQHPKFTWLEGPDGSRFTGFIWQIEPKKRGWTGKMTDAAPDPWLRPIRDSDDDDEMPHIAGKPAEEIA